MRYIHWAHDVFVFVCGLGKILMHTKMCGAHLHVDLMKICSNLISIYREKKTQRISGFLLGIWQWPLFSSKLFFIFRHKCGQQNWIRIILRVCFFSSFHPVIIVTVKISTFSEHLWKSDHFTHALCLKWQNWFFFWQLGKY